MIKIKIARNELLEKYTILRDRIFREENGWKSKNWLINDFDKKGVVFVAVKNNEVLGGVRLMVSNMTSFLSNENPNNPKYTYANLCNWGQEKPLYCELNDIVIHKDYRDRHIIEMLASKVVECAKIIGCKYLFTVSQLKHARLYAITLKRCGAQEAKVIREPWDSLPEYNYAVDYPVICKL